MKKQERQRLRVEHMAIAGLVCGVGAMLPAAAQAQVNPQTIDRSTIRPGARALGMGGAYLLGRNDPTAAIWNPAALANSGSTGLAGSVTARTDNVDFGDLSDLADSVDELADEIESGAALGNVSAVQGSFNDLYGIALNAGAVPGGAPARLRASVEPALGLAVGKFGIMAHSGAFGDVQLGLTGVNPGTRNITANGTALALSTISIPYGQSFKIRNGVDIGTFGVSAKWTRGDFAAANFTADEFTNTVTGTTFDHASDAAFDLDLGYISPAFPKLYGAQAAVVVRNVLSPRFDFLSTTQTNIGAPGTRLFTVRQRPQLDLGIGVQKIGVLPLTVAAELHNITGSNGGDLSFHVGAEYRLNRLLALRAGVDDGELVGGLGLQLGPAQLNLAIGANIQERVAIGLSSNF